MLWEGLILFFSVASMHDLYDELQSRGYDASAPTAEFHGVHEMHLRDPDGYALAFTSPSDAAPGNAVS